MKKFTHFSFSFLLAVVLCFAGINYAWAATSYTLTGTSPNKTLTITGSGDMTDYASGGAPWYSENSNIKTIVINEGVTYVGAYAFQGITYSSITIPVSVTGFGNRAFYQITSGSAKYVYYAGTPNEWAQIDFAMPASYASSHPFYQGSDDASYATNNHIYFYNQTTTETKIIVFTPGIEEIKPYVFWHAGNITNVNIPHSVTSIGAKAFWKCSSLCRIFVNNTTAPTVTTNVFEGMKSGTNASWIYLPAYASASTGTGGYKKLPWYDSSAAGKGASRIGYQGTDVSASAVGNNFSIANSKVYPTSGTVDGISWSLDADGVMTFSGSGVITTTFVTSTGNASLYPWHRFADLIDKVVIKGGVTGISNALGDMTSLREITIAQTEIPTAASTLPTYIHGQKVQVYIDNSSMGDATLSGAPWNNSNFVKTYTTTFCSDPTALTINSIGTATATASWTDDSGDTWKYICKLASEEEPTSSEWSSAASTNSKSVALSSLTPGTRYTFYLMSDCGTMTSNAIDADFTTECAAISIPWNYGFEGCTNNQTPLCWGEQHKSGSTKGYVEANTLAKKTGTYGLRIAGGRSNGSPKSEVIAVFPEFDEEIRNLALTFYYKTDVDVIDDYWGNTIYGKLQLGFVTTEGSFVPFGDPLEQRSTFGKVEGINMSSASDGARFAILYTGGDELGYAAIDDITVTAKPACNKPTSVSASSETAEGATITWNANGMSAWKLQVSEGDAASWGEEIAVATNSKVLTGLKANTLYYVRVKADCGGGSVSEWSDNVSFTTLCGTINVNATTSWNEDFQSFADNVIPDCWDNSASTTTSSWGNEYIWGTYSQSTNRMLRMSNNYLDGGTALINTPSIAIPNDGKTYELTFDHSIRTLTGNDLKVKISSNGGAFTEKSTCYSEGSASSYPGDFTTATISLAEYSGQTIKIQFFANPASGTSSSDGAMFVDNVSVHKVASCFPPTALAAGNLTANSARITWTAGASETAWRLQYRADGGSWSSDIVVNTNARHDLSGLSANTEYFVRVKAYCSAEDQSEWSDILSFTTLCAAKSMPFEENFSQEFALPSCWEATPATGTYRWSSFSPSYGHFNVQLRTGSSGEAELRMPAISLSEAAILRFEWKNASGAQVNLYISTDGGSSRTIIPNDLSGVHDDWTTKIFDLSAYTGETALIYFVANFSTLNQYAYLDDVEVVARPCDMILNIQAAPISGGATISWSGNVQKLQYKTGADGWSTVNIASGDYAGPKTITGLTPAKSYQVRLLPACSADEESNWTEPVFFMSMSIESVPYFNDFESETPGDVPFNWSRISASEFPQVSHDAYAYKEGGSFGDQGNSIKFYGVNEQIIVLPEFDANLGDLKISFHYRNRNCRMDLGYVAADGMTFTAIETLPNQTGYGEFPFEKDLYGISSSASKLAIRYSNAEGAPQAWVDNMSVDFVTCSQPLGLTVSAITATSAHISWAASERGTESNYQYIRRIWNEDDPNWASATLVSSSVHELNLTGLTPNKDYEFYLRSYCGVSDQSTPVKIEFKTLMNDEVFADVASATDNESRLAALNGQTINMTIERPLLLNGDYCTLCLPFDLSAAQIADSDCPLHGFVIKEFEHSENKEGEVNLYLRQVTSIEAGKPYFVRYAGATSEDRLTPLTFNGVKIKCSTPVDIENDDAAQPHGVFNPYALVANDNSTFFLSSNNTLYYPSANGTMNGFRAYVHIDPSSPLGMAIRRGATMRIRENTQTPTDIDNVQGYNGQCTKVLRNGQLYLMYEGRMYDVQGRVVK